MSLDLDSAADRFEDGKLEGAPLVKTFTAHHATYTLTCGWRLVS